MSAPQKTTNLAVVEIDHIQLLLPMTGALKLMEILNKAVRVEPDYSDIRNVKLVLGVQPRLELRMVRSDDVVAPKGDAVTRPRRQTPALVIPGGDPKHP